MTVSDLLDKKAKGIFSDDVLLKGELIALDSKDGKILFDTSKNKREYISKFSSGEIDCLWADVKHIKGVAFGDYFKAVMKCYVIHDSWKAESIAKAENEDK